MKKNVLYFRKRCKYLQVFIFVIALCPKQAFTQNKTVDSIINEISFKKDTIQILFEWVANNIEYDVERLPFNSNRLFLPLKTDKEKITTTLLTKKGVCEDYALVFNSLCQKLGYKSYFIDGYTKDLKEVEKEFGHAWTVIKIKDKWFCFDPTWASGSVKQKTFIKAYNDIWFKVPPDEFIYTHVPYDPIWQLSEYPVIAKINNINLPIGNYFNFEDSINTYYSPKSILFSQNIIYRITKYSDNNENVNQYIKILTENLNIEKYNKVIETLNYAVTIFNNYIYCKNKKFQNPKLKDSEIENLLFSVQNSLISAKSLLISLTLKNTTEKREILQQINNIEKSLKKEFDFFNKYQKTWYPFRIFVN